MASPITWQNVNAASNVGANDLFASSQASITRGLNQLSNAASGAADFQVNKENKQITKNNDSVLAELAGIGSIAQYQEAEQAGVYDADNLTKRFGNKLDVNQIMGKFAGLKGKLQQDVVMQQQYDAGQLAKKEQPMLNNIDALVANKDFDTAREKVTGLSAPASVIKRIDDEERAYKGVMKTKAIEDVNKRYLPQLSSKAKMFADVDMPEDFYKDYAKAIRDTGASTQELTDNIMNMYQNIDVSGLTTKQDERARKHRAEKNKLLSSLALEDANTELATFKKENPYIGDTVSVNDMQEEMTSKIIPALQAAAPKYQYTGVNNIEAEDIPKLVQKYVGQEWIVGEDGKGRPLKATDNTKDNPVIRITPQMILNAGMSALEAGVFNSPGVDKNEFADTTLPDVVAQYDIAGIKAREIAIKAKVKKARMNDGMIRLGELKDKSN